VAALDHAVAAEVARARAMERALHGAAGDWEVRVAGLRVPVERTIDEETMKITFRGMLPVACEATVAELVHEGETVSSSACQVSGPCVIQWDFLAGQQASRAA
jgi:hypothetical protein